MSPRQVPWVGLLSGMPRHPDAAPGQSDDAICLRACAQDGASMLTLTFTYGGGRTSNARQSIRLKCGRTTTPGRLTDLKPNLTAIALRCFSTGPDVAHLNFRSVVDVKGTPTNSMRYLTPFSRLVGPIVLTQT
eukprot:1258175-Rhodomonas_salina.3